MRLVHGASAADAIRKLEELAMSARNLNAFAVGRPPEAIRRYRDQYLTWVALAERSLRSFVPRRDAAAMLFTDRHWHIRGLDLTSARPTELIDLEVEFQSDELERLAGELKAYAEVIQTGEGDMLVVDTNVLLHYQPLDQIDWASLVDVPVRLVIPLPVVEEVDGKKYARREDLRHRAQRVLARLEPCVQAIGGRPVEVRPGVTVEIPPESPERSAMARDADATILDAARELARFTGARVVLVTGDTALRMRAAAVGLPVLAVPAEYLRVRTEASDPA